MSLVIALHVLASTLWVGGMFFAYACLRPATASTDVPVRVQVWERALRRFFRWIWISIALLLLTGFWMFFGEKIRGPHVHLMMGLGMVMMLLAAHVYFAPYKRLRRCVGVHNWQEGAKQLNQIRTFVAINLALGLIVVAVAAGGRYAH
ncbi:MAG TPA: CopD family protein [Nevskiaceae bacterium]|nr:CopD family protein [Nevskiaceae bacterium]